MGDLSEHFSRKEFACNCGCGFDTVDAETLKVAEDVRRFLKTPVTINSGCRCPAYNKKVGGAEKSQHVKARAADLGVANPEKVYEYLCTKYPGKYGFGLYPTFVHIDTRSDGPARWKS